jgi:hypothetical protein
MHTPTRKHAYTKTCNTYCFSTARMVSWTRLNVTLYVHCLSSCFLFRHTVNNSSTPYRYRSHHQSSQTQFVYLFKHSSANFNYAGLRVTSVKFIEQYRHM